MISNSSDILSVTLTVAWERYDYITGPIGGKNGTGRLNNLTKKSTEIPQNDILCTIFIYS